MYQDNRKLSKRKYITVVQSGKCERTPSFSGDSPIYSVYQYVSYRLMHRKGSNRPEGWFHSLWGGSDQTVEIRWLWTEEHKFFAPEISFRPSENGTKLAAVIAKALRKRRHDEKEGPEHLIEDLGAYLVEYVNDNKDGCYDDYRVLQAPGEPAMMTIARYAASAE